ncbi:MAG: hypothetical protein BWY37_01933 [Firmicutes bacterium ADurb.Bin262]|nr:MAG: hypothetical protein BWY37_01933 [Firmicutes bacterium ADurb.Bin262]
MTGGNELFPEFTVIIQFAVIDEYLAAVLVVDRLAARGQVDNAQAAETEGGLIADKIILIVRPSVGDEVGHGLDGLFGMFVAFGDKSDKSAHCLRCLRFGFQLLAAGKDGAFRQHFKRVNDIRPLEPVVAFDHT